jgi:hypothetical protein
MAHAASLMFVSYSLLIPYLLPEKQDIGSAEAFSDILQGE